MLTDEQRYIDHQTLLARNKGEHEMTLNKKWLSAIAILLVIVLASVVLTPVPSARASVWYYWGGISMSAYCQRHYPSSTAVNIQPYNAYSWRCKLGQSYYGISVDQACREQHVPQAFAYTSKPQNPYSWGCYSAW